METGLQTGQQQSRWMLVTNWTALLLAVACLGFVGWQIPVERQAFLRIFLDFRAELPGMTQWALAIPAVVFPIGAAVGVGGVLMLKRQLGVCHHSTLIYLLVCLLCALGYELFRDAMLQPMMLVLRILNR